MRALEKRQLGPSPRVITT